MLRSLSLFVVCFQTLQKQFRQPNTRPKSGPSGNASADEALVAEQTESKPEKERKSVHERIRAPVSYDDLIRD